MEVRLHTAANKIKEGCINIDATPFSPHHAGAQRVIENHD